MDMRIDYVHTYKNILDIIPLECLIHGKDVNVGILFCILLSHIQG